MSSHLLPAMVGTFNGKLPNKLSGICGLVTFVFPPGASEGTTTTTTTSEENNHERSEIKFTIRDIHVCDKVHQVVAMNGNEETAEAMAQVFKSHQASSSSASPLINSINVTFRGDFAEKILIKRNDIVWIRGTGMEVRRCNEEDRDLMDHAFDVLVTTHFKQKKINPGQIQIRLASFLEDDGHGRKRGRGQTRHSDEVCVYQWAEGTLTKSILPFVTTTAAATITTTEAPAKKANTITTTSSSSSSQSEGTSTAPRKYTELRYLKPGQAGGSSSSSKTSEGRVHGLYAFVVNNSFPSRSRHAESYRATVALMDESLLREGEPVGNPIELTIFSQADSKDTQFPDVRAFGDIIRLHRVEVQEYQGATCLLHRKYSTFATTSNVVGDREVRAPVGVSSSTTTTTTTTKHEERPGAVAATNTPFDWEYVDSLRRFIRKRLFGEVRVNAQPWWAHTRTLEELLKSSSRPQYGDALVRIDTTSGGPSGAPFDMSSLTKVSSLSKAVPVTDGTAAGILNVPPGPSMFRFLRMITSPEFDVNKTWIKIRNAALDLPTSMMMMTTTSGVASSSSSSSSATTQPHSSRSLTLEMMLMDGTQDYTGLVTSFLGVDETCALAAMEQMKDNALVRLFGDPIPPPQANHLNGHHDDNNNNNRVPSAEKRIVSYVDAPYQSLPVTPIMEVIYGAARGGGEAREQLRTYRVVGKMFNTYPHEVRQFSQQSKSGQGEGYEWSFAFSLEDSTSPPLTVVACDAEARRFLFELSASNLSLNTETYLRIFRAIEVLKKQDVWLECVISGPISGGHFALVGTHLGVV